MAGEDVDVAIVGGGPAGLSTALFLQRLSPELAERTVILEKSFYPREKICAGAIGGRGLRLLDTIDARPDVPHVDLRGISVATRFGRLEARRTESIGWVVRRREFDAGLAAIAIGRGLRIEQGAVVSGVRTSREGPVELDLVGGRILRAKTLVGADGVGSIVRRSLGFPRGAVVAQAVEIDTERGTDDLPEDLLHFDLTDASLRGYGWDFPTPIDGQVRMSRGYYDLGRRGGRGGPVQRVADPGARLDRRASPFVRLGEKRRFSERGIALREPLARPRVILAGEAAGIDPVLGEGIAQAIFYGRAAARYLVEKIAQGALGFEDYAPLALSSRLGVDLHTRVRSLEFFYGSTRAVAEHFVTRSSALARAGLDYFGGRRVSRLDLARAGADLARSFTVALRS